MRGAPFASQVLLSALRIIPAYAGSTYGHVLRGRVPKDHPRVCGEHAPALAAVGSGPGSSPRMRGARVPGLAFGLDSGIIPAYAGSTLGLLDDGRRRGDHPRVCGEHALVVEEVVKVAGSSPRMRGALPN